VIRIIDGVAYEGKRSGDFTLKAVDLGNGHLEVSSSRNMVWEEQEWSPIAIEMYLECVEKDREERADELRERSAKIAANRAKKKVRHLCKAMAADSLLTLTYRANEQDLDRVKKDLKEFNRRVLRVLPGFCFVAGFEQQKRGAWHVHCAVQRIPSELPASNGVKVRSFNVLRSIWRSITKDRGGNVDVSKGKKNRSAARIAAYISKYVTKAFVEGEKWVNRWAKYGAIKAPEPVVLGRFETFREVIAYGCELLESTHVVDSMIASRWGDWFYLSAEKNRVGISRVC